MDDACNTPAPAETAGPPSPTAEEQEYWQRDSAVRHAISAFGQQGCGDVDRVPGNARAIYAFIKGD